MTCLGEAGSKRKGLFRSDSLCLYVLYHIIQSGCIDDSRGGANTISNFECDGGRGEGGISWWQSKAGIFVGGNMRDRTERQIAIGHWRFENICGGRKLHVLLVV